jgi:hypothetical protein
VGDCPVLFAAEAAFLIFRLAAAFCLALAMNPHPLIRAEYRLDEKTRTESRF